jgi:hypothetical protein
VSSELWNFKQREVSIALWTFEQLVESFELLSSQHSTFDFFTPKGITVNKSNESSYRCILA